MAAERKELDKAKLEAMLEALADEVNARGETLDLFIYGGAAMVLRDEGLRTHTGDVDAFSPTHGMTKLMDVRRAVAMKIAASTGEPAHLRWLTVSTHNSGTDIGQLVAETNDDGTHANFESFRPDLSVKGLNIHLIKNEPQLAMKLLRETPEGAKPQDITDVAKLSDTLGISQTTTSLRGVWDRYKGRLGQTDDKRAKVERNLANPRYWGFKK